VPKLMAGKFCDRRKNIRPNRRRKFSFGTANIYRDATFTFRLSYN